MISRNLVAHFQWRDQVPPKCRNDDNQELRKNIPDSKVHGANMGPTWGRQDPGGPHVGPMYFAIWDMSELGLLSVEHMGIYEYTDGA